MGTEAACKGRPYAKAEKSPHTPRKPEFTTDSPQVTKELASYTPREFFAA